MQVINISILVIILSIRLFFKIPPKSRLKVDSSSVYAGINDADYQ